MSTLKYSVSLKYKRTYRRWSVKVNILQYDNLTVQDYVNWIDNTKFEELLAEMKKWCDIHEIGKHMAYDEFLFKTKADATMFMLRFS